MADKYINATELMTELAMLYKHANWSPRDCRFSLFDMQMNINVMKPVDAVPVVRCKDCKYGTEWDGRLSCEWHGFYQTDPDWFCADGEREDDA